MSFNFKYTILSYASMSLLCIVSPLPAYANYHVLDNATNKLVVTPTPPTARPYITIVDGKTRVHHEGGAIVHVLPSEDPIDVLRKLNRIYGEREQAQTNVKSSPSVLYPMGYPARFIPPNSMVTEGPGHLGRPYYNTFVGEGLVGQTYVLKKKEEMLVMQYQFPLGHPYAGHIVESKSYKNLTDLMDKNNQKEFEEQIKNYKGAPTAPSVGGTPPSVEQPTPPPVKLPAVEQQTPPPVKLPAVEQQTPPPVKLPAPSASAAPSSLTYQIIDKSGKLVQVSELPQKKPYMRTSPEGIITIHYSGGQEVYVSEADKKDLMNFFRDVNIVNDQITSTHFWGFDDSAGKPGKRDYRSVWLPPGAILKDSKTLLDKPPVGETYIEKETDNKFKMKYIFPKEHPLYAGRMVETNESFVNLYDLLQRKQAFMENIKTGNINNPHGLISFSFNKIPLGVEPKPDSKSSNYHLAPEDQDPFHNPFHNEEYYIINPDTYHVIQTSTVPTGQPYMRINADGSKTVHRSGGEEVFLNNRDSETVLQDVTEIYNQLKQAQAYGSYTSQNYLKGYPGYLLEPGTILTKNGPAYRTLMGEEPEGEIYVLKVKDRFFVMKYKFPKGHSRAGQIVQSSPYTDLTKLIKDEKAFMNSHNINSSPISSIPPASPIISSTKAPYSSADFYNHGLGDKIPHEPYEALQALKEKKPFIMAEKEGYYFYQVKQLSDGKESYVKYGKKSKTASQKYFTNLEELKRIVNSDEAIQGEKLMPIGKVTEALMVQIEQRLESSMGL